MALAATEADLPLRGQPGDPAVAPTSLTFSPLDIAVDRCKGCELCVAACPKGVLALDRSRVNGLGHHPIALTDPDHCTSCAFCARVCPDAVFTVYARPKES
jgi:2-oxoglutarate ferredoxin oxidoreductase subunit delta